MAPKAPDRDFIIAAFASATFPSGEPSLEQAWLGIYQLLMWYEDGNLHVNEVSALRQRPWRERAELAAQYLSDALGISSEMLPAAVDKVMQLERWLGMQRQNPLGNAFRSLIAEVLIRWGDQRLRYIEEAPAVDWFPGIQMPGRSRAAKIDVLLVEKEEARAVISCKWSIRHDRISDPTNECQEYKAAAVKRQFPRFAYYVITNEFDQARLLKIVEQPCVDGVVHVHLPLVHHIWGKDARLQEVPKLIDLVDFVTGTSTW